ncbi:MAG: protein kinase domain-containing protein, partial [Chloroflexota bacterium]
AERTIAGRYQLLEPLGEGSLALVYSALDLQLQRPVALKLLRQPLAADRAVAERFRSEVSRAAALSHPNIIAVYDVGDDAGQPFVAMELVQGKPLRGYVDQQAPFELGDVVTVATQVASALDYAHLRGLVHRDLNPKSMLITAEGRIKIGDFGLGRGTGPATLSAFQGALGSAAYLAPEQVQGEAATAATDIYALGVMAYEMLTGRLPFRGETPLEMATQHLKAAPPPPSRFNARLSRQVDVAVLKALSKSPAERYATAGALVDTLGLSRERPRPAIESQPTRRLPVSPLGSPAGGPATGDPVVMLPPAARRRKGHAVAALVTLAGAACVLAAFFGARQAMQASPLSGAANLSTLPGVTLPSATAQALAVPEGTPTFTPTLFPTSTDTPTPSVTGSATAQGSATVTGTPATPTPSSDTATASAGTPTPSPTPPPPTATVPAVAEGLMAAPSVVGLTEAQAQDAIRRAGLTPTFPNYQTQFTNQPPGHVLSQTPSAGSLVKPGTTVYIAVRR